MAIPELFRKEALYSEPAWFIHDVLSMDHEAQEYVAFLDTTRLGDLVDAQREWPNHAKHVPAAVMVQLTGSLGALHAICGLGLLPSEGWVGYGVRVKNARFSTMGEIGPPLTAKAVIKRCQKLMGRYLITYEFCFTQEDRMVYESTQSAIWLNPDNESPESASQD